MTSTDGTSSDDDDNVQMMGSCRMDGGAYWGGGGWTCRWWQGLLVRGLTRGGCVAADASLHPARQWWIGSGRRNSQGFLVAAGGVKVLMDFPCGCTSCRAFLLSHCSVGT